MKKILVILLALMVVGGAFAQTAAPSLVDVLTKAPTVTYGADGAFGTSLDAAYRSDITDVDSNGALTLTNTFTVGGNYFDLIPWFKADWGNGLSFTQKAYYSPQNANADVLPYVGANPMTVASPILSESNVTYTTGGLTLAETVYFDSASGGRNYTGNASATFKSDNVEAKIATVSQWNQGMMFLNSLGSFDGVQITDAYFKISKIFDTVSVKFGGVGSNLYRLTSLSYLAGPFGPYFASNSTIGRLRVRANGAAIAAYGTPYVVSTTSYPIFATYAQGDLTVYGGYIVPTTGANFADYLAGGNIRQAVKYNLKGVGVVDGGFELGLGYTKGLTAPVATYIKGLKVVNNNKVFADFQFTGMKDLTALIGFDGTFSEYQKAETYTSAGTIADPNVYTYIPYSMMNLGVEAKYNLDAAVKGLSLEAYAYLALNSGGTYNDYVDATDTTFSTYLDATYPTATFFRMTSLTEANWLNKRLEGATGLYSGANPMKFYVKAAYTLNDNVGLYFKDVYKAQAGSLDATVSTDRKSVV